MKAKLLDIWNRLQPAQKRNIVVGAVVAGVVLFGVIGYMSRQQGAQAKKGEEATKQISLDPKLIQKTEYAEAKKELERRDKEIAELRRGLAELAGKKEQMAPGAALIEEAKRKFEAEKQTADAKKEETKKGEEKKDAKKEETKFPPVPPPPPAKTSSLPPPPGGAKGKGAVTAAREPLETYSGGIEIVRRPAGQGQPQQAQPPEEKKKDQSAAVYLPPSFMPATLLTGFDAPAIEKAKDKPMPVLIRVTNLAILPNKVKANLRGCFVIAEAVGNLATERADLRLVSLSCVDKKGQAVVDQKIKGFVVDSDSKVGIGGRVVSKMGEIISRTMFVGALQGVGDAMKAASQTTSLTTAGAAVTTINPMMAADAASGQALSQSVAKLQEFYMELAKQTIPVVEVGGTKKITIVVSEGVELKIKPACVGEGPCEKLS